MMSHINRVTPLGVPKTMFIVHHYGLSYSCTGQKYQSAFFLFHKHGYEINSESVTLSLFTDRTRTLPNPRYPLRTQCSDLYRTHQASHACVARPPSPVGPSCACVATWPGTSFTRSPIMCRRRDLVYSGFVKIACWYCFEFESKIFNMENMEFWSYTIFFVKNEIGSFIFCDVPYCRYISGDIKELIYCFQSEGDKHVELAMLYKQHLEKYPHFSKSCSLLNRYITSHTR